MIKEIKELIQRNIDTTQEVIDCFEISSEQQEDFTRENEQLKKMLTYMEDLEIASDPLSGEFGFDPYIEDCGNELGFEVVDGTGAVKTLTLCGVTSIKPVDEPNTAVKSFSFTFHGEQEE